MNFQLTLHFTDVRCLKFTEAELEIHEVGTQYSTRSRVDVFVLILHNKNTRYLLLDYR